MSARRPVRCVRHYRRPTRSLTVEVDGCLVRFCICERAKPVVDVMLNRQGVADLLVLLAEANALVVATDNLLAVMDDTP